jgi:hypothetical protein
MLPLFREPFAGAIRHLYGKMSAHSFIILSCCLMRSQLSAQAKHTSAQAPHVMDMVGRRSEALARKGSLGKRNHAGD